MTGEMLDVTPNPENQQEVGRVNNDLEEGSQEAASIQQEIGLIQNERKDTVQHAEEIGRTNNELPGTKKPEQPEVGIVYNESEESASKS